MPAAALLFDPAAVIEASVLEEHPAASNAAVHKTMPKNLLFIIIFHSRFRIVSVNNVMLL